MIPSVLIVIKCFGPEDFSLAEMDTDTFVCSKCGVMLGQHPPEMGEYHWGTSFMDVYRYLGNGKRIPGVEFLLDKEYRQTS